MTDCCKRKDINTDTQKDSHVKTEAEFGVMLPQAKECLGLQEAGRNEEGSIPGELRGSGPCQHLHFGLWLADLGEQTSTVLSDPVCGTLLWQL